MADILNFIDAFYSVPVQGPSQGDRAGAGRRAATDRKFKQKVWTWLTRNPEVFVGKNREGNRLSLDEVELLSERQNHSQNECDRQHPHIGSDGQPSPECSSPQKDSQTIKISDESLGLGNGLRIFVSELRMWFAITGHEPDSTKVFPLEFALLSIIAASKEKGIVQSDLTKLSGQDSRSVPKRTSVLYQKGYIEKIPIQFKSTRTSLCVLAKFARQSKSSKKGVSGNENGVSHTSDPDNMIDFPAFLDKLFGILKETKVISRDELKQKLGMEDRWRRKTLRRAVQKLEVIGCIRRVKATAENSDSTRATRPSILLLREPTQRDLKLFHQHSGNLVTSLENDGEIEEDQEVEFVGESQLEAGEQADDTVKNVNYLEPVGRPVPQWVPDRIMPNMIYHIVDRAGKTGMTNIVSNIFFFLFFFSFQAYRFL